MRARRILVTSTALCLLVGAALATQVVRLDLPALVSRAEIIVEGRCLAVSTSREPDGVIVTEVSILVDRGRKGARDGDLLRFSMPGGELWGRRLVLPGLPDLQPGDEVFLFLTPTSSRGWRLPVGLGQGLFRMARDPLTGERQLTRDLTGLQLVDDKRAPVPRASGRQTLAYAELARQVQRLLEDER